MVIVIPGINSSTESLISDSNCEKVGPSNGSNKYSYNLVPKLGKKYLVPFLVYNKWIKLERISSLLVSDKSKNLPSYESLNGKLIPYVNDLAILHKYKVNIIFLYNVIK